MKRFHQMHLSVIRQLFGAHTTEQFYIIGKDLFIENLFVFLLKNEFNRSMGMIQRYVEAYLLLDNEDKYSP